MESLVESAGYTLVAFSSEEEFLQSRTLAAATFVITDVRIHYSAETRQRAFVQKFAKRQGKSIVRIPDEVMEVLQRHDWPGNIRELQNVIEGGVIMTTGPVLSPQTTEHMTRNAGDAPIRTLADAERAHITATLRETNGVVGGRRGAAAQLGLPRTTLVARMQRLGISGETSGRRAVQPDRAFVTVPRGHSHVSHGIQEEDGVYDHSYSS
jgi:hypothetical protein